MRTELRVGNTISHANDNGFFLFKVEEIKKDGVIVYYNDGEWFIPYTNIKPVKLNHSEFTSLGFQFKEDIIYWATRVENLSYYFIKCERVEIKVWDDGSCNICDYQIEFTHQLQNLYFILTGKELLLIKQKLEL